MVLLVTVLTTLLKIIVEFNGLFVTIQDLLEFIRIYF